jgi:hypothetical protein
MSADIVEVLKDRIGAAENETIADAAIRIMGERDTYKSLCASQHKVITGYEEQEAAMVAAIKRAMPILEFHEYRTNEDMGALVACQAALEKAGVEL